MSQNTSPAVLQQRHEAHDSLDDFPTLPWGTRALCELIRAEVPDLADKSVWEPACNRGYMTRPLREYFRAVCGTDIHNYSTEGDAPDAVVDFLWPGSEDACAGLGGIDWVWTNPPFRLGQQFAHRALSVARQGVALLVRSAFTEGQERYGELYSVQKPWAIYQFVERLSLVKGQVDPNASRPTAYSWIVWRTDLPPVADTLFRWIPPCRKRLERDSDYEVTP